MIMHTQFTPRFSGPLHDERKATRRARLDPRVRRPDARQGRGRRHDRVARDPVRGRPFADRPRRDGDDLFRSAHGRQAGRPGAPIRPRQDREHRRARRDRAAVHSFRRGDVGIGATAARRSSPRRRGDRCRLRGDRRLDRVDFFRARVLNARRRRNGEPGARGRRAAFQLRHVVVGGGPARPRRRCGSATPGRIRPRPWWWRCSSASPAGGSAAAPSTPSPIPRPPASPTRSPRSPARCGNVASVERVRTRQVGGTVFGEIDVGASRTLPLDRVEALKDDIEAAVRTALPNAEIGVNVTPRALDDETVMERVMVIARNRGLAVHHVTVHTIPDRARDLARSRGRRPVVARRRPRHRRRPRSRDPQGASTPSSRSRPTSSRCTSKAPPAATPPRRDVAAIQRALAELAAATRRGAQRPRGPRARNRRRPDGEFPLRRRSRAHRQRGPRARRRAGAWHSPAFSRRQARDRPCRAARPRRCPRRLRSKCDYPVTPAKPDTRRGWRSWADFGEAGPRGCRTCPHLFPVHKIVSVYRSPCGMLARRTAGMITLQ